VEICGPRLLTRIAELARVGGLEGGGCCRLALTEADKAGRAQVVAWMRELGMDVRVDALGNTVGRRAGRRDDLPAVMTGSHIDTVRTGGIYDGSLGVLAGLEIIQSLHEAGHQTEHPLEVGFFTNEEGSRFAPDMMGSLVYVGDLAVDAARAAQDAEGVSVGDALDSLGLAGDAPVPGPAPHAFVELHIEQGPVLDREGVDIGVVTAVQGIRWQKLTLTGVSNHAGTSPMSMRADAVYVAARITTMVRELTAEVGAPMVGTVGHMAVRPNLVNVVANHVELTTDLRHVDAAVLVQAEATCNARIAEICAVEGVGLQTERLASFDPFSFDPATVGRVRAAAAARGLSHRDMVSGAGHDAQIHGRVAPAAMVFVPSVGGISHNIEEHTEDHHLVAGAQVLMDVMLGLAS